MKIIYSFVLILILTTNIVLAQWYPQNSGTNEGFWRVNFVSENIGWATTYYKIYKTVDGGNHWYLQKDVSPERVITFQFVDQNTGWYIGTYTGTETNIRKTTDGGESWDLMYPLSDTYLVDMIFINDTVGWCVGVGGFPGYWVPAAFRTTDGGSNWEYVVVSPTYFINFNTIFFLNEAEGWITGYNNIFKTSDGGSTWTEIPYIQGGASALKLQFLSSEIGWSASDGGLLLRTTDGGNSWIQESNVQSVNFYFSSVDTGWSISAGSIFYTSNSGNSWISQNSGTDNFLWDLSFIDANKGWVVGDSGTILHTIDGGIPVELESLNAKEVDNEIILSWITTTETNNRGFEVERLRGYNITKLQNWENIGFVEGNGTSAEEHSYSFRDNLNLNHNLTLRYRLKQIDFDGSFNYSKDIEVDIASPREFSLEQNYPNPFNPVTTIKYSIPSVGTSVVLKVYDILGNEIATLVNEEKAAGNYSVNFDGSKLPSGVYIYRLKVENYSSAKKLILLK